jgi:uncharacterized protein
MPPTKANGKICYLEIPALDIKRSVDFYTKVFGWRIRTRGDGSIAFDDAVSEVSGSWVRGRKAWSEPGLLIYIMVDSVKRAVDLVVANGGAIVQPLGADAPEITARFTDPAGNVIGLYQDRSSSRSARA